MGNVIDQDVTARARALMAQLRSDLEALVRVPSVSVPGRVDQPLLDAFELTSRLFADAGVTVDRLDLPDTAPVVTGEIPAPAGAPTVLLYSHYDVVPAGDETLWSSPPFEPTQRGEALVGRGVADTKSNVLAHVGALRAWGGRPPVGIKLCIEGYEEIGSGALTGYPATDAGRLRMRCSRSCARWLRCTTRTASSRSGSCRCSGRCDEERTAFGRHESLGA